MATVLYPTRAGDSTYRNQDRAVALAQERQATLLLLYVSNVKFLDHFAAPVNVDLIEAELDELGEFLLAMAQERADKNNIEVEAIVRHGAFRQALSDVVQEYNVTSVVLGRPTHDAAHTTIEYISHLAQALTRELGVECFVVHEGEVVEEYRPPDDE